MAGVALTDTRMRVEDYLEMERSSPVKHEYVEVLSDPTAKRDLGENGATIKLWPA